MKLSPLEILGIAALLIAIVILWIATIVMVKTLSPTHHSHAQLNLSGTLSILPESTKAESPFYYRTGSTHPLESVESPDAL